MKATNYLTILCFLGMCVAANAAITPGTWTSHTATTAVGSVGGVTINATNSGSTTFASIHPNRFGNGWDTDNALGNMALGLTTTSVGAGDSQTFTFSSPLLDGTLFYIENFDTNSIANIKASTTGAIPNVSVLSTSNVLYVGTSVTAGGGLVSANGVLTSSNATSDGNGDVILVLDGGITELTLDYTNGGGGNGIFYTFAEPCAVPEPTSALVMAGLFGIGGVVVHFRRRKQQS